MNQPPFRSGPPPEGRFDPPSNNYPSPDFRPVQFSPQPPHEQTPTSQQPQWNPAYPPPMQPPPAKKSTRNKWVIGGVGAIILVCCICPTGIGAIAAITSTPTATPGRAAAVVSPGAVTVTKPATTNTDVTPTTGAAPTIAGPTSTPVPAATDIPHLTRTPAPTNTPQPTATALPSIGSTVSIEGWEFTLDGYATHDVLTYDDIGSGLRASGIFYVYRISAKNTNNESGSFGDILTSLSTFQAGLVDDHKATYADVITGNSFEMDEYAKYNGFNSQSDNVVPRGKAKYLLVFDVAPDAKPTDLYIIYQKKEKIHFDLTGK